MLTGTPTLSFIVGLTVGFSFSPLLLGSAWYAMGLALLIGVIYQITGNLMTKEIRENYPDLYKELVAPLR
jgi:hypothetical protein